MIPLMFGKKLLVLRIALQATSLVTTEKRENQIINFEGSAW
jgi:hypothetical protein